MGTIERIRVPPEDREWLEKLVRDRNTPQKVVWRARIVLLAGEGTKAGVIARRVGKSVLTVRRWRRRYAAKGVDGLLRDATRPPGRKPLSARKIKQVVYLTFNEKPPNATHWSLRTMAARVGIAAAFSKASPSWSMPSWTTSKTTTPTPSPSSGQSPHVKSSKRSHVRNMRWNQYTSVIGWNGSGEDMN